MSHGTATGFAFFGKGQPLQEYRYALNALGEFDVEVKIAYSGVCHSDIHTVRCEWGPCKEYQVVGHEMMGHVTQVGGKVTKFKVGDYVGVGPQAMSCRECEMCKQNRQNYCTGQVGFVGSYGGTLPGSGYITQGGYANYNRTHEDFVVPVPSSLDAKTCAPLMCAGVTVWTPLKYAGVTKGTKFGLIGLGGLGHLAVKFAVALGANVTVISTSKNKEADAKKMGAQSFLVSTDKDAFASEHYTYDVLLNTASGDIDYSAYLPLLKKFTGQFLTVSGDPGNVKLQPFAMLFSGCILRGSLIGSPSEIAEMLQFCADNNITPETECFRLDQVNEVHEKCLKNEIRFRGVLEI